ncbi:MAG: Holliday junction branch migration protein RuvA [Bacteroidales bacterium]|nr:Holliday junction branch migration protein RuvA [Bacteroidales bacterium]
MYEYIEGKIDEINPAYVILENNGTGYFISISLTTYSQIQSKKDARLLTHLVIREDAHLLYGFFTRTERDVFRQLITVSGVGANTARMMLSSMSPSEIQKAILTANVVQLKSIKGIGSKTAERIIVELRDKIGHEAGGEELFFAKDNRTRDEALSALIMLGFPKSAVEKVVNRLITENKDIVVEDLVKKALKSL